MAGVAGVAGVCESDVGFYGPRVELVTPSLVVCITTNSNLDFSIIREYSAKQCSDGHTHPNRRGWVPRVPRPPRPLDLRR